MFKTGSFEMALGTLVKAWVVAQKWYLIGDRNIPIDEWRKQKLSDDLIAFGFAERVGENQVRMCGADKQFSWLIQRQINGKKGGLASHAKSLNKKSSYRQATARDSKPLSLTPTLPLTLSLNKNTFDQKNFDRVIFDFESVYKNYPRKIGKTKGIAQLKRQVRKQEEFDAFYKAVLKYREICEAMKTEKQYIMHFSTFVGTPQAPRWKDYLEDGVDTSDLKKERSLREILMEEGKL